VIARIELLTKRISVDLSERIFGDVSYCRYLAVYCLSQSASLQGYFDRLDDVGIRVAAPLRAFLPGEVSG
jgi:hypothetical protein